MGIDNDGARDPVVEGIGDHETLLRLTWHPEDLADNGMLLPTAISSQDLQGTERGVSVNRAHMTQLETMMALADRHQVRKPLQRIEPYVNAITAGQVRSEKDELGVDQFLVKHDPLPENLAHAQIISRSKRSKSQARQLRLILIRLFSVAIPLKDYFCSQS